MRIVDYLYVKLWNIRKFIATTHVDVYPRSPLFDAYSEMKLILLNRKVIKLDTFKTPMTKQPGVLDVNFIFVAYPSIDTFHVHYPDNWHELVMTARKERND